MSLPVENRIDIQPEQLLSQPHRLLVKLNGVHVRLEVDIHPELHHPRHIKELTAAAGRNLPLRLAAQRGGVRPR